MLMKKGDICFYFPSSHVGVDENHSFHIVLPYMPWSGSKAKFTLFFLRRDMQDISGGTIVVAGLKSAQCWRCQTWDGDASGVGERGERGEGPTVIGLSDLNLTSLQIGDSNLPS